MKQKPKKRMQALLLCLLPAAAYGLLLLAKTLYARFAQPYLPPCLLRTATGIQCPGCGMTHSVYALTELDFAGALRANAAIPFLVLLAAVYYAELWLKFAGHPRRLIPRKTSFLYGCLSIWLLYCILRNLI